MRKLLYILFAVLLFSSCSVYEDIFLHKDKSIRYQSTFELTEETGLNEFMYLDLPTDSAMSLKYFVEEKYPYNDDLSEVSIYLDSLDAFYVRAIPSRDREKYMVILEADFNDDLHLNKSMATMGRLMVKLQEIASSISDDLNFFNTQWNILWDGKTMKRSGLDTVLVEDISEDEGFSDDVYKYKVLKKMLNIQIRYHFDHKVKTINQPDALMSQDGKIVVVFPNNEDYTTIEIKVK